LASAVTTPPPAAHRAPDVEAVACPRERGSEPLAADATPTECRTDADCTAGQNGRCVRVSNHGGHGPSLEASRCSYDACFADADCADVNHAICWCGRTSGAVVGEGHSCSAGECTTDADCGEGRYCRRGGSGRFCHSPADECLEDQPCPAPEQSCQRAADGIYRCSAMPAVYG
jgi:Cys-rich repeat protein